MNRESEHRTDAELATTGISGLDDVLAGGLTTNHLYLIEGVPGSGKTTLALQFLLEGHRRGEPGLYITLSETKRELEAVADSHGWNTEGVNIRELIPPADGLAPEAQYTMFHPSEVELTATMRSILDDVERVKPRRLILDSLSELRLLAGNQLRYRRQILALKQYFAGSDCTVLLLDDISGGDHDVQVQSIVHGVLLLEQMNPEYGTDRRRLRVAKFRGHAFRGGYHDYVIRRGGLDVFPRLVAAESREPAAKGKVPGGIAQLDDLMGGGLERGTSTLVIGAAGTGKSTLAAQYAASAAALGVRGKLFIFDEHVQTLVSRTAGLGIPLKAQMDAGMVAVQQVDPAELSPGELVNAIRHAVEQDDAGLIVIDSLNGYLNAMPGEKFLTIQLHELLMYLGQRGVATILIGAHQGLIGANMKSPVDASYLADSVVLLRYFEARGEVRQAISVLKKRGGPHERSIREFSLSAEGIHIGPPLMEFRGILTGVPVNEPPHGNGDLAG